jgi:hypothetical protein
MRFIGTEATGTMIVSMFTSSQSSRSSGLKRPEFRFNSKLSAIFKYRDMLRQKLGNRVFIIWEKIDPRTARVSGLR